MFISDEQLKATKKNKPMTPTQPSANPFGQVADFINTGVEKFTQLPVIKEVSMGAGAIPAGAGAIIGGATGALGEAGIQAYKAATGNGFDLGQVGRTAMQTAQETANFGQEIGQTSVATAPLAAGGTYTLLPIAYAQSYQGVRDIKSGIESGDPALALQGGISLGSSLFSAALGARGAKNDVVWAKKKITEIPSKVKNASRALFDDNSPIRSKFATKLGTAISDVTPRVASEYLAKKDSVNKLKKTYVSPQEELAIAQDAVTRYRNGLSEQWRKDVDTVKNEHYQRISLSPEVQNNLKYLSDQFGVEYALKDRKLDLNNLGVEDALAVNKIVNEALRKGDIKASPRGAVVRDAHKSLRSEIVNNFGGEQGSVNQLLSNYAAREKVLSYFNEIVNAYKSGKPVSDATSLGRLRSIYNENKPAYLQAVKDFEANTGLDLTSDLLANRVYGRSPINLSGGGLPTRKGILYKIFEAALKPTGVLIIKNLGKPTEKITPGRKLNLPEIKGNPRITEPSRLLPEPAITAKAPDRTKLLSQEEARPLFTSKVDYTPRKPMTTDLLPSGTKSGINGQTIKLTAKGRGYDKLTETNPFKGKKYDFNGSHKIYPKDNQFRQSVVDEVEKLKLTNKLSDEKYQDRVQALLENGDISVREMDYLLSNHSKEVRSLYEQQISKGVNGRSVGDNEIEAQYNNFKKLKLPQNYLDKAEDLEAFKKLAGKRLTGSKIDDMFYSQEKTGDEMYQSFKDRLASERKQSTKALTPTNKAISTEKTLLDEARKYKTADEFINKNSYVSAKSSKKYKNAKTKSQLTDIWNKANSK